MADMGPIRGAGLTLAGMLRTGDPGGANNEVLAGASALVGTAAIERFMELLLAYDDDLDFMNAVCSADPPVRFVGRFLTNMMESEISDMPPRSREAMAVGMLSIADLMDSTIMGSMPAVADDIRRYMRGMRRRVLGDSILDDDERERIPVLEPDSRLRHFLEAGAITAEMRDDAEAFACSRKALTMLDKAADIVRTHPRMFVIERPGPVVVNEIFDDYCGK